MTDVLPLSHTSQGIFNHNGWANLLTYAVRTMSASNLISFFFFFLNWANPLSIIKNGNATVSEVQQEPGKKGKASSEHY